VLALLEERPMHGYEMITEVDERTGGAWRPSAGSIYPTLQLLEDEGLIEGTEAEGKRRFELTEAGREERAARSGPAPWDEVTACADPERLRLGRAAQQLREAVAQVFYAGDEEQRRKVRELLDETRRKVYGVLAADD
jgi:DNA-binding PadR family transcriptional regulator